MIPATGVTVGSPFTRMRGAAIFVFRKRLPTDKPGRTRGRTIQLDAGWLATHPFYLNAVLVHEMAHVAPA
jgi:hypothetical protein